jgi:hypothetical protein
LTAVARGAYLSDRAVTLAVGDGRPEVYSFCSLPGVQEHRLPLCDRLEGQSLELVLEAHGGVVEHSFSEGVVRWKASGGSVGADAYEAFELRDGILLLDFSPGGNREEIATWVLDLTAGRGIAVRTSIVPGDKHRHAAVTSFHQAGIGGPLRARFEETDALAGKRVLYHYGRDNFFEHIYLTSTLFTWHGVAGLEAGVADTEPADTFAVAEDLFLFAWTERVKPHQGAVVVDLAALRSNGRLVGFDLASGSLMHVTVGSRAIVLNETDHHTILTEIKYDSV